MRLVPQRDGNRRARFVACILGIAVVLLVPSAFLFHLAEMASLTEIASNVSIGSDRAAVSALGTPIVVYSAGAEAGAGYGALGHRARFLMDSVIRSGFRGKLPRWYRDHIEANPVDDLPIQIGFGESGCVRAIRIVSEWRD